jgi:hypothetical protein
MGGSFFSVVIDDFDIGRSFRFPFEADSKLVIDANTELALAAAAQRFQPIAAKRSQVFKGSGRVEPDQASSNLFFDVHQFNDAMAAQQFLGSRILERLNHTPMVLLYGYREFRRAPLQAEPRQQTQRSYSLHIGGHTSREESCPAEVAGEIHLSQVDEWGSIDDRNPQQLFLIQREEHARPSPSAVNAPTVFAP